jgi:hypothetical protein
MSHSIPSYAAGKAWHETLTDYPELLTGKPANETFKVSIPKPYFPSIANVRRALVDEQNQLRKYCNKADLTGEDGFVGTAVRLQVNGNKWFIHTGLSDYDQDHRGFWGGSGLCYGRQNLTALARELLGQAKDHYYSSR